MIMITAKQIRRSLAPHNDFWVRRYKDGQIWCGTNKHNIHEFNWLKSILKQAGYKFECNGKPGTAGEYIIEIKA